jgi:aminopeptidase N
VTRLIPLLAAAFLAFALPSPYAVAAPPAPKAAAAPQRIILPDDVSPVRYEIRIRPDAEQLTFHGRARIEILIKRPTDRIVLNAADLTIERVRLSDVQAQPRIVLGADEQIAFLFPDRLLPGPAVLEIDYAGRIYQQPSGLFALDSGVGAGRRRALYTQFENSDARRFAPMWDEPGLKAVFSLTVEAPEGQMAVSNMPAARTERLADGRTATTFADTPKMSSYLLFMALGDFERIQRKVGDVEVGVVTLRGEAEKGRYALDTTAELLPFYNDYFGTPYPLPKLDLIAGPGQSQFFSAMENWGAIFSFERAVLLQPNATPADRQRVFTTTAHELAHQWFGDLVTMAWWDDLWLNEGFASWMESKAADAFHPEWKMSLQDMASRERAMRLDAGAGTHPVITPIRDVFAASNAFDAITYQKGRAVVAMLEAYVGEEAFRSAIRSYMASHAYGNTTTDQLWAELDRVSPASVTDIAHDFTLQPGVPLIDATGGAGALRLTQTQFTAAAQSATVWRTPVRVASTAPAAPWTGVVSRDEPRRAPVPAGALPIVNAGQAGYFRTRYSPELWARFPPAFGSLAAADQLGLLYDARALADYGLAPIGRFLELSKVAPAVEEPVVLSAVANELAALARIYRPGSGEAYRAYARLRLRPVLARIGWDPRPGEGDNVPGLRDDLIRALGDLDDPGVKAEARRRFQAALARPGSIDGALERSVQAVVARHADIREWEQLHALARQATATTERNRLYRLLGSAKDPALVDRALLLAISDEPPATTAPGILSSAAALHPDKAFDFAIAHRAQVDAMLEPTSRGGFYARLGQGSRDKAMVDKLKAFALTLPASSRGEVRKAVSEVRHRRAVSQRWLAEVNRWLAANPG